MLRQNAISYSLVPVTLAVVPAPLPVPRPEVAPFTGDVLPRVTVELVGAFAAAAGPLLVGTALLFPPAPPRADIRGTNTRSYSV